MISFSLIEQCQFACIHLRSPIHELIYLNTTLYLSFLFQLQETNSQSSDNESYVTNREFELLYRHSVTLTAVYCVAYVIVFIVGLIGNSFVIAVVLRSPRMRTVTNYFIVNLAVADILVIVFCLPATLMSNIFVRKY